MAVTQQSIYLVLFYLFSDQLYLTICSCALLILFFTKMSCILWVHKEDVEGIRKGDLTLQKASYHDFLSCHCSHRHESRNCMKSQEKGIIKLSYTICIFNQNEDWVHWSENFVLVNYLNQQFTDLLYLYFLFILLII